jgi:hypothetical protein
MGWFNRRDEDPIQIEIPDSTLKRWALYDIGISQPNEVAKLIGLTPVSDEGEKKEIEESEQRIMDVLGYMPFVDVISDLSAKIIVTSQIKNNPALAHEDQDQLEEDIAAMTEIYRGVAYSSIVLALSIGTHLGLVPLREE